MSKLSLEEIKQKIANNKKTLEDIYHVKDIGVFGSYSRGDFTPKSDIDILVEFSEPIGFFKFIDLEDYLKKIMGKKVDLVTKKALKNVIKEAVLQEVVYV